MDKIALKKALDLSRNKDAINRAKRREIIKQIIKSEGEKK